VSEARIQEYDGTSDPYVVQVARRVDGYVEPEMREALQQAEAAYQEAGQVRSELDGLLQALVDAGMTPDDLQAAVDNVTAPEIEILPLGGDGAYINRCREMIEQAQNQMMQNMGVPRELLVGTPEGTALAAMTTAQRQLQALLERGLVSRRTVLENNAIFVNEATAADIRRAWAHQEEEEQLFAQMWDNLSTARARYAQVLGRPTSMAQYHHYMFIGKMLSQYTMVEEGRQAFTHEVVLYLQAEEACAQPPLTYEQTPRPLVSLDQRARVAYVTIENRDTVPERLRDQLEAVIAGWPTLSQAVIEDDPDAIDALLRELRAEFERYLQDRNRQYLSYYFAVRRDMNELSMEEVREWTGSGPSAVGDTALEFTGTAGTTPPPLYPGFTTKAAWSSDEIEQRQLDPRLRSDQVESLVLRMRDICRTRNFTLDGCKYTVNASAPVRNNCRTFVFKVLAPTDNGLRFRLLVRLFQKIDDRGLSQWGYQVTEENSDVTIRAPRTYNNPEAVRQQQYNQDRQDQQRAEQMRERARRSAHASMVGAPDPYPPPPPPPPPPPRLSRKPEDEPLPEGRPLDL